VLGGIGVFLAIVFFVTAHEAGHFFAAKATGMKVTEFFFGFGPRLWSVRRGETEYGVKALPLGGYVKIVGMSALDEVDPADHGRTYREQAFWKKSLVVLSGVTANFVLAYLMIFGLALAEGRVVTDAAGDPVLSTRVAAVVETYEGVPTAAVEAGLRRGDQIVAVDGTPTPDWQALLAALEPAPGEQVALTVVRDGEQIELGATLGSKDGKGFLGFAPDFEREALGVLGAGAIAGEQIGRGVVFTFESFGRFFRLDTIRQLFGGLAGEEVPEDVRPVSVVGLVQIGSQVEEFGLANLVFLLAVVNVILGTLNVLPLYPLDGGHFAVALVEKLTGRTVDIRKLAPVAAVVVGLISLLGLVAIVLDIISPIDV
jgi:membrane-associated protease RseP (regulator of RpoE activity)